MKRVITGGVIVVVIVAGVFLIFHRSSKPAATVTTALSTSSNAPTVNNAVLKTRTNPSVGQYLTDPDGNALYIYTADTNGTSNCMNSCLAVWPAYEDKGTTTGLPADVATIKRPDNGQIQYTYKGRPLYHFASDGQGQVSGNGIEGFKVAKP